MCADKNSASKGRSFAETCFALTAVSKGDASRRSERFQAYLCLGIPIQVAPSTLMRCQRLMMQKVKDRYHVMHCFWGQVSK